jgi:hypothetical protein
MTRLCLSHDVKRAVDLSVDIRIEEIFFAAVERSDTHVRVVGAACKEALEAECRTALAASASNNA